MSLISQHVNRILGNLRKKVNKRILSKSLVILETDVTQVGKKVYRFSIVQSYYFDYRTDINKHDIKIQFDFLSH